MDEDLFENIKSGKIRLYEIEKYTDKKTSVDLRRAFVEEKKGVRLEHTGNFSIDAAEVVGRNIENMIGAVQVPLGVAGPLRVNGEYASGEFYIPLATTEGALVASTNRGCSVITASGGANVRIFKDEMTRAPVFKVKSVIHARDFIEWVNNNFLRLKEKAAETTKFGELLRIDPYIAGRSVFLRMAFDTKDAMGMNMATIASEAVSELILSENDVELVSLSGNMCTDKKPAQINAILGRGKTVAAESLIPPDIIESKLKTNAGRMAEVNYRKNLLGSARAGSIGLNAQAANIAAAMFIACGQDAAHVVEASNTITTMELCDNGLHCSVTIPSLQVGTVGGGTRVATQKECLDILGVAGSGQPPGSNAKKFAEIIAAAILAGEISLIGAQAAGHLAKAHAQLGR